MEDFEGRRRGILSTGEWSDPVSKMPLHMKKVLNVEGIGRERLKNSAPIENISYLCNTY